MRLNPHASRVRPALKGPAGAVAAAHPLAVSAGLEMITRGGNAVDAAIAAQACLGVVAPDSCGIGGDALVLVREPRGTVMAVNGAGASGLHQTRAAAGGGLSVTVPGTVAAWQTLSSRWGRLPLSETLQPAIRLAHGGIRPDAALVKTAARHAHRFVNADSWPLATAGPGGVWLQQELGHALEAVAAQGAEAFYSGRIAEAIERAVAGAGGALRASDLEGHEAEALAPLEVRWRDTQVFVQPPTSQGVLLAMVLKALDREQDAGPDSLAHIGVELTEAAFQYRDRCGAADDLLDVALDVDPERASRRGGPRSYLHTAGVSTSDAEGLVVSSLTSVFDQFGSGVFVPEGGFMLNNRGAGFTQAPNDFAPGKRPVHTLAPMLLQTDETCLAMSTPGADGQIQTLLQILLATRLGGCELDEAVDAPRWRSEDGRLLIERGHRYAEDLQRRGHDVVEVEPGDVRMGAVTSAGRHEGAPFALSDWRRLTWHGAV